MIFVIIKLTWSNHNFEKYNLRRIGDVRVDFQIFSSTDNFEDLAYENVMKKSQNYIISHIIPIRAGLTHMYTYRFGLHFGRRSSSW